MFIFSSNHSSSDASEYMRTCTAYTVHREQMMIALNQQVLLILSHIHVPKHIYTGNTDTYVVLWTFLKIIIHEFFAYICVHLLVFICCLVFSFRFDVIMTRTLEELTFCKKRAFKSRKKHFRLL